MTNYINSIQPFSIVVAPGPTATTTISAVGSNAFIVWQGTSNTGAGSNSQTSSGMVTLTNSTTVTGTIGTSAGGCTVFGVVIDPTSSLVTGVQFGTITLTGTLTNTATITSVDTTKSVVFYLGQTSNQAVAQYNDRVPVRVTLTNATTVTASRGGSTGTETVSFVVVTFAAGALNSSIQQFQTAAVGPINTTQTITSVVKNNTMLAWGGWENDAGSPLATDNPWLTLTNSTTATMTSTANVNWVTNFAVVEFVSGVLNSAAQYGTASTVASTSGTATISSVNTSNAFVAYLGQTNTVGAASDGAFASSLALTNATTITAQTGLSSTETTGYEVIEFSSSTNGIMWYPDYPSTVNQAPRNYDIGRQVMPISPSPPIMIDWFGYHPDILYTPTTNINKDKQVIRTPVFPPLSVTFFPVKPDIVRGPPPYPNVGWYSKAPYTPPVRLNFFPVRPDIVRSATPTVNIGWEAFKSPTPITMLDFFPIRPDIIPSLQKPNQDTYQPWAITPPVVVFHPIDWFPSIPDSIKVINYAMQPPGWFEQKINVFWTDAFTENVTASDTDTVIVNFVDSTSENSTAADIIIPNVTYPFSFIETVHADDNDTVIVIKNSAPIYFVAYYHPIIEASVTLSAYYKQPEPGLILVAYYNPN